MAKNEDNDPDDDDQHVHSWHPNIPTQSPLSILINKAHHI